MLKSLEEAPRFLESHQLLLDLIGSDTATAPGTPRPPGATPKEARP